jgi:hypothetical protein
MQTMAERPVRIAPDGTIRGDPIKGSHLFRTFCVSCGEPMRCSMGSLSLDLECEDCNPTVHEFVDLRDLHEYPSQEGKSRSEKMGGDMDNGEVFEKKVRKAF